MLGGSSSMNAMIWVRGFAADYDEWAEHAGEQWSYANIEGYFDRIESGPWSSPASAAHGGRRQRLADCRAGVRPSDRPTGSEAAQAFARHASPSAGAPGGAPPTHTSSPRRHLTSVTEAAAMKVVFETRGPRRCQPGLARRPARRCRRARSDWGWPAMWARRGQLRMAATREETDSMLSSVMMLCCQMRTTVTLDDDHRASSRRAPPTSECRPSTWTARCSSRPISRTRN